jgi:uncharacterized protein YbcI
MSKPSIAEQIAQAAWTFEQQRTGHGAQSMMVTLNENMLFITLRDALSPAELAIAQRPSGAAQVQLFHQELFAGYAESLKREVQRITGTQVNEATVLVFTSGTMILVLLLADSVPTDTWSGPAESLKAA